MNRAHRFICQNKECMVAFYAFFTDKGRDLISCPLCGHSALKGDEEYSIFDSKQLTDALSPEAK